MYYQNTHSLNNKVSLLRSNFPSFTSSPNIIVFSKTWLKSHIHSSELGRLGYNIFRLDRRIDLDDDDAPESGGGVLIAFKKHIVAHPINCIHNEESLFVGINHGRTKMILCAAYMPPKAPCSLYEDLLHSIDDTLTVREYRKLLVIGDFNLPNIVWSNKPLKQNRIEYISPTGRAITRMPVLKRLGPGANFPKPPCYGTYAGPSFRHAGFSLKFGDGRRNAPAR